MRLVSLFLAVLALALPGAAAPSDELFDKLKAATNEAEAAMPEADVLAALLESDSGTTDLLMERASIAAGANDFQLARELLDRVVILSPDFTEGWFQRSALFLRDENYGEALRDLEEVLKLQPRHFPAWYRLGTLLRTLGSTEEAKFAFEKAVEVHPNLQPAKRALARLAPSPDGPSL